MRAPSNRSTSLVVAALLLALGACTSGSSSEGVVDPTASPTTGAAYVALGDSFTAGPGITPQSTDAGLCQRSEQNWPSLLADQLGVDVTDLSCSGAATADLAATVAAGVITTPPRLVTVGAGGNDEGLFLSLLRACASGSAACTSFVDEQAPAVLGRTTTSLESLLDGIGAAAPGAEVVLVGYLRLLPVSGTCPEAVVSASDAATVARAETSLDDALRAAAEETGVKYVSLREASEGHDVCSGDAAWVNGTVAADGDGIGFHPNRKGMVAVADLVAAAVEG